MERNLFLKKIKKDGKIFGNADYFSYLYIINKETNIIHLNKIFNIMKNQILTNDNLRQIIPSAYTAQADWLSNKYQAISTENIVDEMRSRGWNPVKAVETGTKSNGSNGTAKRHYNFHMVHFRHDTLTEESLKTVGDSVPEMVLINSNNGARAFRFEAGIFRLVCSNGMIVKDADMGSIRQVHMGEFDIVPHIEQFIHTTRKNMDRIIHLQQTQLDKDLQVELAERAMDIRFSGSKFQPVIDDVLKVRRQGDVGNDGWKVVNRIQEALIRGGIRTTYTDEKKKETFERQAGEVKSLRMSNEYNQKLFNVVDEVVFA